MFNFFANIFGYALNMIYEMVNNYGIAIIIFTVILKLIMLPITIKQQKTMKKSTKVQEKVKEVQKKYSNDPTRLNQEVMELYKRENMSPFSGCLSSIIQLVLVISIFYMVSRPLTYVRRVDPEIINNYQTEIQEDGKRSGYPEIAIIKSKAAEDENVKINMEFLTLDLSDIPSQNYSNWKVFVIPVLYVLTSFISTRLLSNLNKKPKESTEIVKDGEEVEEKELDTVAAMNKNMMLMMPIMAVSIALIAPLGLALYWLVSNILMIGERLLINKYFKSEEE